MSLAVPMTRPPAMNQNNNSSQLQALEDVCRNAFAPVESCHDNAGQVSQESERQLRQVHTLCKAMERTLDIRSGIGNKCDHSNLERGSRGVLFRESSRLRNSCFLFNCKHPELPGLWMFGFATRVVLQRVFLGLPPDCAIDAGPGN
jgi:hypothetical protein